MLNDRLLKGSINTFSLSLSCIDDYPASVPAAGWRNGTSLNNAGDNGNYWSSSCYDSSNNSYNLNFNSGNRNVDWNNRNNGFSVRSVSEFANKITKMNFDRHFSISQEQLLKDLFKAYKAARLNKRGKKYQLNFEYNLEDNLVALRDELLQKRYKPLPSDCFIIHDPKMREIFAAQFRDRIVHHLFYNYTYKLFERTFIYDCYSCIEKRGTHFGIERLKHHIRSVSSNFSLPCYVLKIDIKGYFMSIDRNRLWNISEISLENIYKQRKKAGISLPDKNFVKYLLECILCFDPTINCRRIGLENEWEKLPPSKSLFCSKRGYGLPIGNLSSQLFSNIYLNKFDMFVKRTLGIKHYGRYVDDAFLVFHDRQYLKDLIFIIKRFLEDELALELNMSKTRILNIYHGVEFLGAYLRPFRTYVSSSSLTRIVKKVNAIAKREEINHQQNSVNSFLGVFSHYDSYCLRKLIFVQQSGLNKYGRFNNDVLKFRPFGH